MRSLKSVLDELYLAPELALVSSRRMENNDIHQLSDLLFRVAYFRRPMFFKLWNQLRDQNLDWPQRLKRVLIKLLELQNLPEAPRLPSDIEFVSMVDRRYLPDLLELPQPPVGLFIKGELKSGRRAAVIGSRKPTPYARRVTRELTRRWTEIGWIIVSGGAIGIDAEAHAACLEAGGSTWVVMGSGHHHLYPAQHERLFREALGKGGAIISEYPPNTEARPYTFPERNRIIAALGQTLFLAQAHGRSGSLSTARAALDLGRDIHVLKPIPGDENFAGSQNLIDAGAKILIDAKEFATAV